MKAIFYNHRQRRHSTIVLPQLYKDALETVAALVFEKAEITPGGKIKVLETCTEKTLYNFVGPDNRGCITAAWCDEIDGSNLQGAVCSLKLPYFTIRGSFVWWEHTGVETINFELPTSVIGQAFSIK